MNKDRRKVKTLAIIAGLIVSSLCVGTYVDFLGAYNFLYKGKIVNVNKKNSYLEREKFQKNEHPKRSDYLSSSASGLCSPPQDCEAWRRRPDPRYASCYRICLQVANIWQGYCYCLLTHSNLAISLGACSSQERIYNETYNDYRASCGLL